MTREEVMTLGFEELETRANEIAKETASADKDMIEALNAELDAIEERKMVLMAEAEERRKKAEEVANGAGREVEEKREGKKMTDREIRSSQAYIDAYVAYVKSGYDVREFEKRMAEQPGVDPVITTELVKGEIPVPVYLEDRIRTAWENDEILGRCRRTFLPGLIKVGVEVSADPAVVHQEGGEAISAENLVIDFITLYPEYLKKMIKITHTVMALTGTSFLDYLYDEIEYQIVKKAAANVIAAVGASTYVEQTTAAGANLTTVDIINAQGQLAGDARPVLITTRAEAAKLRVAALSANYGYDPFDGLSVIYTDGANFQNGELALVIDLDGVQCNFPEGANPRFIFDEFTEADKNVVRIIGRLLFATDLVATGKAVAILEGESE